MHSSVISAVSAGLADAIGRSPVQASPFVHTVLTGIFAPPVLASLTESLPSAEEYLRFESPDSLDERNPYRSSWRLKLDDRGPADPSSTFRRWVAIADELKQPHTVNAFIAAFANWLPSGLSASSPRLKVGVRLYRDLGGSWIGPHTDGPDKVMTCIIYLPSDAGHVSYGTKLLRPKDPGFVPVSDHLYDHTRYYDSADDFDIVRALPYLPNTGLAIVRSPLSFHSVTIPAGAAARYSLMYRFLVR